MAKIISFINLKGGVGKTTSAVAISEFLAVEHRQNVLLIDLDPQTNATTSLISEQRWLQADMSGQTIKQLFDDYLVQGNPKFDIGSAIIRRVSNLGGGIVRLSLLPSSLGLIEIQDQLAMIPGLNRYAVNPVEILQNAMAPVLGRYDWVIIDCPPSLGLITLNGINISDGYIIPVVPDILSTYGVTQIINRIRRFSSDRGRDIPPLGIIVSKYRVQSLLHQTKVRELRRNKDYPKVFETIVREAARIAGSMDFETYVDTLRQKYGYGDTYGTFAELTEEFIETCRAVLVQEPSFAD